MTPLAARAAERPRTSLLVRLAPKLALLAVMASLVVGAEAGAATAAQGAPPGATGAQDAPPGAQDAPPRAAGRGDGLAQARERARGEQSLERLRSMSDADLRGLYDSTRSEARLAYRRFDSELSRAFRRAMVQGSDDQRRTVERALRAALGDLATTPGRELAGRITERGAMDPVNIEMRDAALHLAMLARITGDRGYADRSAALLARFAEVIPRWPIWNPYHEAPAKRTAMSRDDPATFKSETAAGLWGMWIYFDLMMGTPLVEAFTLLEPTGAIERCGARESIRHLFELHLEVQRRFGAAPDYTNMDAFQIRGLMDFGRLLPDPELVHEGVRRLRDLYRTGFYPDGWWHEGALGYHADLQNGLRAITEEMLQGYSDPPGFKSAVDGSRFDDLDLAALVKAPMGRAERVIRTMVLPDGNSIGVHDTPWPTAAPRGSGAPTESILFGAMGRGLLVSGAGDGYALAMLEWGPTGTHAHADALNLLLWAKGTEVISETQYRPLQGSDSTREWHTSTAAHATVVVDGVNQSAKGARGSRVRTRHPEDAIDGLADWRFRWGLQSAQDGGDLRLFSTTVPEVQVMEADAVRAYDSVAPVTVYRRTVALVRIDDQDSYVADIFRVRGGSSADFMLHGALQLNQTLRLSVPLQPMAGTAHGMLKDLRAGTTDGAWLAAFEMENGVTLITFMAAAPGTTVIQAAGPAMRRLGEAPFVIARRQGPETVFVAVHHAMRGASPRVQGVEMIPAPCPDCVAFRVRVGDRTDTIVSCGDRSKSCVLPGGIEVRGRFAHVAEGPTAAQQWALLVDGDLLRTPAALVEGETSREGTLVATRRQEAGDPINGFVVKEAMPAGDDLAGSTIIVDQAGEMTWAYGVRRVEAQEGASVIVTPDEPGLRIEGDLIKQTFFPLWGFRGPARYRVPGAAIARPPGAGAEGPPPTAEARVSWKGA